MYEKDVAKVFESKTRVFKKLYKEVVKENSPVKTFPKEQQGKINALLEYSCWLRIYLGEKPVAMDAFMISYFEQIVDAAIMELYFTDELHSCDKYFIEPLMSEELPKLEELGKGNEAVNTLRNTFNQLFDKEHPIRVGIYFLNSVPIVRKFRHEN